MIQSNEIPCKDHIFSNHAPLIKSSGKKKVSHNAGRITHGEQTRLTSSPPLVSTGLDMLKVSLKVKFNDYQLFARLSTAKNHVQSGHQVKTPIKIGAFSFNIHRNGTKLFPYHLSTGDIHLFLSTRDHESTIDNCKIEIGSISSQKGARKYYHQLKRFLEVEGCEIMSHLVSEVHLAADFFNMPFIDTCFHQSKYWVSKGRTWGTYEFDWRPTGMTIGQGDIMLRCYDKIREMIVKQDEAKQDFFSEKWGIPIEDLKTQEITRVEFQLRRPVLKEFTVTLDSVEDIYKNLQAIWNYCCQDWSKHHETVIDRKNNNQKQAKLSGHWEMVQEVEWGGNQEACRSKKTLVKSIPRLRAQARGLLMSICAAFGHDSEHEDGIIGIIKTAQELITVDLLHFFEENYSEFVRRMNMRLQESYSCL